MDLQEAYKPSTKDMDPLVSDKVPKMQADQLPKEITKEEKKNKQF